MKRNLLAMILLPTLLVALNGCYSAPVKPPVGLAFSQFRAPLSTEFHQTPVTGKVGKAEATSILGLVAQGDASAATAAQNGGIQKIDHADYEYYNVLGVYQVFRTVVYGQ